MSDAPAPAAAADGSGRVILDAEDVVMRFDGIRAVDGASLSVRKGSITALIGPNGAGKTTLFNVLTGFYRPHGGSARFVGKPVLGTPAACDRPAGDGPHLPDHQSARGDARDRQHAAGRAEPAG